jgi:hypothetical protein
MERLREKLVQLPEEFLTNWLKKNLQFAVDASSARLTEFGKVWRRFLQIYPIFSVSKLITIWDTLFSKVNFFTIV